MPEPVIVDTDPGHDACAILRALASPGMEVLGLTPVALGPMERLRMLPRAEVPAAIP